MPKYKIELDRINCVASVGCVEEDPQNWKLNNKDDKVDMVKSKQAKQGIFIREIDESQLDIFMRAAKSCPVNVIHIYDETGKKMI